MPLRVHLKIKSNISWRTAGNITVWILVWILAPSVLWIITWMLPWPQASFKQKTKTDERVMKYFEKKSTGPWNNELYDPMGYEIIFQKLVKPSGLSLSCYWYLPKINSSNSWWSTLTVWNFTGALPSKQSSIY